MTNYAVGDLQGCLDPLLCLLEKVNFDPQQDQLWAAGDIVNRGPQSLQTLRYVKALGPAFKMVLGNHDLHLLAAARGFKRLNPKDTLDEILDASDRDELLPWLQQQPLLLVEHGYAMVHAGIPPHWSLNTAQSMARKVEAVLRSDNADLFFENMYGNKPASWNDGQCEAVQLRTITNYFTRMRFCDAEGELELSAKKGPAQAPIGFAPWYIHPQRKTVDDKIIFGHWASLNGDLAEKGLYPLDTGCVWGGRLRLMNLSTTTYSHCECA
ncbi:MAG: symmetrical bis(5'-nucleosyl)-tetraphosphatase [Gammaproteobacteria bacterium]|nr:symmetrical bis(5'-nucleosyl)-tetraphosphatase [Gammaproteobacteria bacterium]MBQ0839461.1 symmetrical bis(5'-nucleosyl)-tetraphosphatase [Gammaproteobacteria bacterium]